MKNRKTMFITAAAALVGAFAASHMRLLADDKRAARAISREAALDNIARGVLLPAYSDLAAKSASFAAPGDPEDRRSGEIFSLLFLSLVLLPSCSHRRRE